jgi:hypothetical protein
MRTRPDALGAIAAQLAVLLAVSGPASAQGVIERARARHNHPDTVLASYRSRLTTLVSIGLIKDPLAPPQLLLASELAAAVAWDRRAGLQIRMLGQRYVTGFPSGSEDDAGLDFSEPWFVATTPGDSLRILGGIELPSRAAVHPFARGAERYYRYEIGDTISLFTPNRPVDLVEVRVTPTRGDEALVVGSIWVDAATGDVGAMQIRFVGKPLWASEDHPEGSGFANRILSVSATIEQGLWEGRFWLPDRQELELMVRIPFLANLALPVVFRSDFGRYDVNRGQPIVWLSPDSARTPADSAAPPRDYEEASLTIEIGGDDVGRGQRTVVRAGPARGGWEIIRPPDDSLAAYNEWDRPLEAPASILTLPSAEELERRARALPAQITGRSPFFLLAEGLPEWIRYNRVEALAVGLPLRVDIPRLPFWSLGGALSFGLADLEPKGRLDLRYEPPATKVVLAGYSELHLAGSAISGNPAYGSALRAFFSGRDDADYYRASGLRALAGRRWGRVNGQLAIAIEDHESVERNTDLAIPGLWEDSTFRLNPPVSEGTYYRGDVSGTLFFGGWPRPGDDAELGVGLEVGSGPGSREYSQLRSALGGEFTLGSVAGAAFRARAGWTGGDAPIQRAWRIGGLETVRGFEHGILLGDSYWTGRIELSRGRRVLRPVVFADVGWAGDTHDWPGHDPAWSVGAGASLLWGALRVDLVFPEADSAWLEVYFGGEL